MNSATHSVGNVHAEKRVTVRLASLQDAPHLLEISNWAAANTAANFRNRPETLEEWRQRSCSDPERFPCFVADADGRAVGFALASPFHDGCGFGNIAELSVYIHPDFAGRSVGTLLYDRLIPTLVEQGYQSLVAMIALPNPASERLHQRFGFERSGGFCGVGWKFGRWHDISFWQKTLRQRELLPLSIKSVNSVCQPLGRAG